MTSIILIYVNKIKSFFSYSETLILASLNVAVGNVSHAPFVTVCHLNHRVRFASSGRFISRIEAPICQRYQTT